MQNTYSWTKLWAISLCEYMRVVQKIPFGKYFSTTLKIGKDTLFLVLTEFQYLTINKTHNFIHLFLKIKNMRTKYVSKYAPKNK